VFLARLRESLPAAADRIEHAILDMRGGKLNDSRFGERMHGQGARWQAVEELFDLQVKRLGLNAEPVADKATTFERATKQLRLW
jgi:hypothetical protein